MRVYPGSELGSSEEFMSGEYTYLENDEIYSLVVGESENKSGEVNVNPVKRVLNLSPGTVVYGMVENILGSMAIVSIIPAENEEDVRYANPDIWAALHISKLGYGYVKEMRDVLMIGDIIRAEVIKYSPRKNVVDISMEGKGLGVVIPRFGRKIKPKSSSSARDRGSRDRGTGHRSRERSLSHRRSSRRTSYNDHSAGRGRTHRGHEHERNHSEVPKYKKSYETNRRKRVYGKTETKHSKREQVVNKIKKMLKKK
ncbi:exosome complex RNA-binding protein Csl4 [Candidatus Micrarchaeota archaeon]|nr:exosome complex RNA-binding protein Csl4 [Candidatus Micrarchaeota archaeon]